MAEDEPQQAESLLPYNEWSENALREVVASAIAHVAEHGLPGEHHFYITFRTNQPGVVIPPHLRAQYPEAMTIILQHQFWNLRLDAAARAFSVGLSFGGVETTLVVPLAAVTGFADPAVRFGLQFRVPEAPASAEPAVSDEPADGAPAAPSEPQIVSLDAFRRRPPPKS
jgi:hypothetical protein